MLLWYESYNGGKWYIPASPATALSQNHVNLSFQHFRQIACIMTYPSLHTGKNTAESISLTFQYFNGQGHPMDYFWKMVYKHQKSNYDLLWKINILFFQIFVPHLLASLLKMAYCALCDVICSYTTIDTNLACNKQHNNGCHISFKNE